MKTTEAGRLAFREEGDLWNCYWARSQSSMEEAILLGSIRLNLARQHRPLKDGFMALMKSAFDKAAMDLVGAPAIWGTPRPGPEHERGGRS
jgi:hypothetical protein